MQHSTCDVTSGNALGTGGGGEFQCSSEITGLLLCLVVESTSVALCSPSLPFEQIGLETVWSCRSSISHSEAFPWFVQAYIYYPHDYSNLINKWVWLE